MNRKAKWVGVSWMAVALLPVLVGIALAVNATPPQTDRPIQQDEAVATMPREMEEFEPSLEKAKDLIGARVLNDQDERLGTIHDIVLTPNRDAISYVVLSHGGIWGIGDKFFAVPWSHFSFRPGETPEHARVPILSGVARADLERAPGFDKNNWPTTASDNWLGIERAAAGTERQEPTPARTPERETAMETDRMNGIEQRRLGKLLDMSVRNFQEESLGRLDNAIIDVNRGQVAYGILSMRTGFLRLSREYVAVPWSSLDLISQPGIARLDIDRQTLTAMAFREDEFPNLEDMQYSRQLHAQFNATPYWEVLGFVPGEAEPYGMPYPKGAKTICGTVESIGTYRLEGPAVEGVAMDGVSLRLRTEEGMLVTVHVAPREYLERQNIAFQAGEQVTVMGSETKVAEHDVIIASQIQTADRTLNLRTPEGKPLWQTGRMEGPEEGTSPAQPRTS